VNLGLQELIAIFVIGLVPLAAVAVLIFSTVRIAKSLERASRALEEIALATRGKNPTQP
jgi:hypothetical protein